MLPFQGYHSFHHPQPPAMVNVMDGGESTQTTSTSKSTEACNTHKEAERRRRQRINNHLSTLRTLLPNTIKTDKASLLAEVVQHVKELKARAAEAIEGEPFPGESNEAKLTSFCCGGETEARMVRVSVCCEDRPGLNRELSHAMRSVGGRTVRAEIMTVGGRNRTVVVMEWANGCGGEEDVEVLKSALEGIVDNKASGSCSGRMVHGKKRARVCGLV